MKTRPTADELNEILKGGGLVQITTYTRSTLYRANHAGMFFERNDSLYVRRGRSSDQLSMGDSLLVGIRTRQACETKEARP